MKVGKVSRWIAASAAALMIVTLAASAADMSHEQLMHKIQIAKTPADHEEIASIYEQQARADRTAAEQHRKMEKLYTALGQVEPGRASPGQTAKHCQNIAASYERAAQENDALAKLHRQAASEAR